MGRGAAEAVEGEEGKEGEEEDQGDRRVKKRSTVGSWRSGEQRQSEGELPQVVKVRCRRYRI